MECEEGALFVKRLGLAKSLLCMGRRIGGRNDIPSLVANLDKLPSESPFNTQVAVGHRVVERRRDAHNFPLLRMNSQRAPHAAIGANRVRARLA